MSSKLYTTHIVYNVQTKRESDCKSIGSEDSSVPSDGPSPRSSCGLSRSRDQMDLLFSDNLQRHARSLSRSPSPIEPSTKPLVSSKSEDTSQTAQSVAMVTALKSLSFDNLDSFVNTQPKGMIQVRHNFLIRF